MDEHGIHELKTKLIAALDQLSELRGIQRATGSPPPPPARAAVDPFIQRAELRRSEEVFRAAVPAQVSGRRIIEIRTVIPAGLAREYVTALVVVAHKDRYGTGRLICKDDHRSGAVSWHLTQGHYGIETLELAHADIDAWRKVLGPSVQRD